MRVQESLLQAQWPASILEHENACAITAGQLLHACMDCPRYAHLQHEISQAMAETKARLVCIAHDKSAILGTYLRKIGLGLLLACLLWVLCLPS
jgi:hypothetical protein